MSAENDHAVDSGGRLTPDPNRLEIVHSGVPFTLCKCPAGEGWVGSRGFFRDEAPLHRVRISNDFWMGETPVTREQWRAVMDRMTLGAYRRLLGQAVFGPSDLELPSDIAVPSRFKGPMHPMDSVSWYDAVVFCERARELGVVPEGWRMRLPTEGEWEYACRAGGEADYALGDGEGALARAGWYYVNSGLSLHAVGLKEANAWGLCDMHGSVREWCWDAWDGDAYVRRGDPAVDPLVVGGASAPRVQRGGSWTFGAVRCRAAFRYWWGPVLRDTIFGFRVCLVRASSWRRPDGEDGSEWASGGGVGTRIGATLPNKTRESASRPRRKRGSQE